LWIRMRADADLYTNDSIYVQFSGSVSSGGAALTRIGSTSALAVVLEDGTGAGVQGWGWADSGFGTLGQPVYFNQDGTQTLRIQQREDGARIDQIVISANTYADRSPGVVRNDKTFVPVFATGSTGAIVGHVYPVAGSFPARLTLDAGAAGKSIDTTTAVIK